MNDKEIWCQDGGLVNTMLKERKQATSSLERVLFLMRLMKMMYNDHKR